MDSPPKNRLISNPNISTGAADAFWQALRKNGATSSIVAVDDYVTVVELSGAGFLFNGIEPTFAATFQPVFRPARA